MAVKNISTRMSICGRSSKCRGGHSAVEQSSYISREKMYCEYDGQTYYPKYSEDLVHSEVILPSNAPRDYQDPYVLWNAVELYEKGNCDDVYDGFSVTRKSLVTPIMIPDDEFVRHKILDLIAHMAKVNG